jgi:hypothetical protein
MLSVLSITILLPHKYLAQANFLERKCKPNYSHPNAKRANFSVWREPLLGFPALENRRRYFPIQGNVRHDDHAIEQFPLGSSCCSVSKFNSSRLIYATQNPTRHGAGDRMPRGRLAVRIQIPHARHATVARLEQDVVWCYGTKYPSIRQRRIDRRPCGDGSERPRGKPRGIFSAASKLEHITIVMPYLV